MCGAEQALAGLPEGPVQETSVGQTVWVKDDEKLTWIRGAVEGHDERSGAPLVRPVEGRMHQPHGEYYTDDNTGVVNHRAWRGSPQKRNYGAASPSK